MAGAKPRLSVVIPTLGRATLVTTLESLVAARGSDSMEILVVGQVADRHVADELRRLSSSFPNLKHLPLSFPSGDSSNKKNAGFRESSADIVAFIDDDVVVAPDWPDRILEAFGTADVGMVSGPSLVPDDLPLMARLAGSALSSGGAGYVAGRYLRDNRGPRRIRWSGIIGCNMAFHREALEKAGGFDPGFWPGEEMVVSFTVAKLGYAIVFAPDACLHHYPRSSLRGFVTQIYKYGATRIRLIRKGVGVEPSTLVPALWALSLAVLGVGAFFSRWAAWLLVADIGAYFLADMLITAARVAKTRKAVDLLIFMIVPVMHLSYGIAQWVELLMPGRDLSESQQRGSGSRVQGSG